MLDEIDKVLNNYVMRLKEWYGWNFPKLVKVVPDALTYAKLVIQVGFRVNYSNTDLEGIVDGDIEVMVKPVPSLQRKISKTSTFWLNKYVLSTSSIIGYVLF